MTTRQYKPRTEAPKPRLPRGLPDTPADSMTLDEVLCGGHIVTPAGRATRSRMRSAPKPGSPQAEEEAAREAASAAAAAAAAGLAARQAEEAQHAEQQQQAQGGAKQPTEEEEAKVRALVLEPLARSDRSRRGRGTRRRSSWGGRASSEWAEALRRRLITRLLARRRGGRRLSGAYRAVRVALAIGASGQWDPPTASAVCSVHSFPKYQRIAHFTTCRRTRAHAQHVCCM